MLNGHHSWAPPSLVDILLRIESRLGGLENGQRTGHANDREIYGQLRQLNTRVSTLEAQRTGTGDLPKSLTERFKAAREGLKLLATLLAVVIWGAAALGIAINPELMPFVAAFTR